jgi:hypothetical protein
LCNRHQFHVQAARGYAGAIHAAHSDKVPLHMKKRKSPLIGTTDYGNEEDQFKYKHFGGFWHLLSVCETNYQNGQKMEPIKKNFKKPISVLFELDLMRVTWFFDPKKPYIFPFHLSRNKLITNDVFLGLQVFVKYLFEGHIMKWNYTVNIDENNYSVFQLKFKRDI